METFEQIVLVFLFAVVAGLPIVIGESALRFSDQLDAERNERDKKAGLREAKSIAEG